MKKQIYTMTYGLQEAECKIELDPEVFKIENAKETLEFFVWDYNKAKNPIDEFMRKLAIRIFIMGVSMDYSESNIIACFENEEGWPKLDGSQGLKLIWVENFELDPAAIHLEKKDKV